LVALALALAKAMVLAVGEVAVMVDSSKPLDLGVKASPV
jgi:hypothetical protein